MVKAVTAILLPQAENKGLMLSFSSDLSQGLIKGDEYCVTQALTNIVDNAIKYTEKGRIDIALNDNNDQIILFIKDTGIGISEEYLDEIFEVFTQESTGYTKRFQGVGLGLALSKRYLELCQATIDVESEKGVGTTFTLTFQKVKKAKAEKVGKPEATAPEAPAPESEKKPLILLVEDDLSSQKLLSFYLKRYYDSCVAVSVEKAKQMLKSEPVELILLDLSLIGVEDGLDLTRYLRKTKRWKEIPIIATTAHVFETDREKCFAAGCNDYLAKPIKQMDLLEKIKQYV